MKINSSVIEIAIAENCLLFRKAIVKTINSFQNCFVVVDAGNGKELINEIAILSYSPSVCILEIDMPILNGYDTLVELKKMYPEMLFLVLTIFRSQYSIKRMIENGANGYILKDSSPEDLNKAILDVHRNRFHYSKIASEQFFKTMKKKSLPELTEKELHFIRLLCSNYSYSVIGETMHISARSVEYYHNNVCEKLGLHSRMELALFAIQSGLVSPVHLF